MKDLQSSVDDIIVWQRRNFAKATSRSTIMHLASELGEALCASEPRGLVEVLTKDAVVKLQYGALKTPATLATEIADIFILLVQLADTSGIDIAEVVDTKMKQNYKRVWNKPDSMGVVEHK